MYSSVRVLSTSPSLLLRHPDWIQDEASATAKWGDIGDWDVSDVKDFSWAFSKDRDQAGGSYVPNGNPKAVSFVGAALSKWKTISATTLSGTFDQASEMNADLSKWNVAKVTTLYHTFRGASKFAGTGLDSWDTASVTTLHYTFYSAGEMNSDLSKWSVAKVVTLQNTFGSASKFIGTDLGSWDTASVTGLVATFRDAAAFSGAGVSLWKVGAVVGMAEAFDGAAAITPCNKRQIANAWKDNPAFIATTYDTDWAATKCPPLTDASFKAATWGK